MLFTAYSFFIIIITAVVFIALVYTYIQQWFAYLRIEQLIIYFLKIVTSTSLTLPGGHLSLANWLLPVSTTQAFSECCFSSSFFHPNTTLVLWLGKKYLINLLFPTTPCVLLTVTSSYIPCLKAGTYCTYVLCITRHGSYTSHLYIWHSFSDHST